MEIKAIGAGITKRIKNPFSLKNTSSNPFEKNMTTGKTFNKSVLTFSDVFESKGNKAAGKMKLMSASVVSAITNFGHKISQPVVNFAKNVKVGLNKTISAIKELPKNIETSGSKALNKIMDRLSPDVITADNTRILSMRHINTKASVKDLKNTWINENNMAKGV